MSERDLARQYRLQQWAEAIREQKASGLTINQWCEAHSIGRHQFFYRQRAVRRAMAEVLEEKQVPAPPLSVSTERSLPAATSHGKDVRFTPVPPEILAPQVGAVIRVRCGKAAIEVSNDASDRILSLLREVILHAE